MGIYYIVVSVATVIGSLIGYRLGRRSMDRKWWSMYLEGHPDLKDDYPDGFTYKPRY